MADLEAMTSQMMTEHSTGADGFHLPPLHPAFVEALETSRESLNERFRSYSAQGASIDGPAFLDHLARRVSPLVAATHECFPERSRDVTVQLYGISLELFRAGYWNQESRLPHLSLLWEKILPRFASLIACEPNRVVGALSNAFINIAQQPSTNALEWLKRLESISERCQSVNELLAAVMVLAWRCGLAQLRQGALERLEDLPYELASRCMCDEEATDVSSWQIIIDELRRNRWSDAKLQNSPTSLTLVKWVGAFRGFGGFFVRPPVVSARDRTFMVSDQVTVFQLCADHFGSHLLRQGAAEEFLPIHHLAAQNSNSKEDSMASHLEHQPVLHSDGTVVWNGQRERFAFLAGASSQAFDGQTLAVTLPTSFHIYLVALTTSPSVIPSAMTA